MWTDLVWAWRMMLARRYRRRLSFSARDKFDGGLRPRLAEKYPDERTVYMMYPDAIYHAKREDFVRAVKLSDRQFDRP